MKLTKYLAPVMAAVALAACDGGTGSNPAQISIRLHDAPGDLEHAWVRVDRVYLQGTSAADSTSGRVDLLTTKSAWIDLTTLTGSNFATLVPNTTVPAGNYSQLRIVVCEAYVVTDDGSVYATDDAELPAGVTADGELRIPSGCSSGFKVKLPGGGVELENDATILSVDFDVSQSFGHVAGNSGAWVMHPVMTATDVGFSGGISGTVALGTGVALPTCGGAATDLSKFVPLAITGADSVAAVVSTAGAFSMGVTPGTYTMAYAPEVTFTNGDSLTFTAAAAPTSATVASGGNTTVNYTISAATCH
jgi:hypothetical protein